MTITRLEPFILHAPVTRGGIADSTHSITHWGAPGVAIHSDGGHVGYGFCGTHAHLPTDHAIVDCILRGFGPLLVGADPMENIALWQKLSRHSPIMWVGRAGLTHLALAAIDIALWDLKSKILKLPLWKLLGGSADKKLEAYNTDGGWLNWSIESLVDDCRRMVEKEGYRAVKIKLGSERIGDDLRRLEAVRNALGPNVRIMTDANGKWTLPHAQQIGVRLADYDVVWLEEPIWFDDVAGHKRLAEAISTPIALGEQLYHASQFRDFLAAGAVHYVQPDVTRVAGITEWWQVADLAHAYSLPVAAHAGEMAQIHQHTCRAHPACTIMEYIPWLRDWMEHPARVEDGHYVVADEPGASTTPTEEAFSRINVLPPT